MDALSCNETVTCEKRDGMALVSIDRPHVLNALNRQPLVDLLATIEGIRDDGQVAGMVLTAAGNQAYAAGADINGMLSLSGSRYVRSEEFR